ncbi:MAG: FIST C-terminal domain-containing protein [Myxococcota bacterium]|nr:FIST C-terminal domain-containing protein [Myxococcota bacterium]
MTKTAAVYTDRTDSEEAGRHLGEQVNQDFEGAAPDALIVFASSRFEYEKLLEAISATCKPRLLVGSSSAGEFTGRNRGEGTACALAVRSSELHFAAGLGRRVSVDRAGAARDLLSSFKGLETYEYAYRSALIMADALAGHAEDLVEQLTLLTSGKYQFAGGGAGDDAKFSRTHVFLGTKAYSDAVVGLELLSDKPLGIGVGHGWTPASKAFRVTEAAGMRVTSLNGMPAVEAFDEHAKTTNQAFDRSKPLPFFLHNILGIDTGNGHRLRVPLVVNGDGSVTCAAEITTGARVHIMKATADSAVAAASNATAAAVAALNGEKPGAALFFDCVATRLRMGEVFGFELESVAKMLGGAELVGCNTYGQIARADGQFGGFHNCTAVVMVLPS